jgi:hypothetical protein
MVLRAVPLGTLAGTIAVDEHTGQAFVSNTLDSLAAAPAALVLRVTTPAACAGPDRGRGDDA